VANQSELQLATKPLPIKIVLLSSYSTVDHNLPAIDNR